MLMRTVNTDILSRSIIGNLIVERSQFRNLDKVSESLLGDNIIGYVELEVGGFLCEYRRPSVETPNNSTHRKPI